ncbi:tetratricopeptide repeat protein [bacterium]|nr:tetratricopeptide repeat protein [bacterium]
MGSRHTALQALFFLIFAGAASPIFAQESLPDIVERISPSVVVILTYDETGEAIAQGSGFFVNDKGDVVTNFHVIEGASSLDIKTSDGKLHPVTAVLAEDMEGDLAVLSVDVPVEVVRVLPVNVVLPRTAESIIVIGCPLGLELTVSDGIVSAVRNVEGFGNIVQITAPISPGSSGGPVVDMKGNVIGVAMGTIIDGQNLNFAIPGERVSSLVSSVVRSAPKRTLSEPIPKNILAETLYQSGLNLMWAEEIEQAFTKFHQAIEIKPDFPEAYFYVGYCYNAFKNDSAALSAYEQSIRLRPTYAAVWCNKGSTLSKLGRYIEAIQAFDRAIDLKPDLAEAWYNKGLALRVLMRNSDALQAYEKAIQLKPDYAKAWCYKGVVLNELGRFAEALQAFERATQLKPDYVDAWYNKGLALGNLEGWAGALYAFERTIQLKPDYAEAWYNKGITLDALGRNTEALRAYDRAMQLNPGLK